MTEQQAAPGQADLHQRIARVVPYCRDGCDFCEPDTVAAAVLAVVEPELTKRQERGDIWKAKAAELEQDRDRLAAELAALREQHAATQAENERLREQFDAVRTVPDTPTTSHLSPPLDNPTDYERGWAAAMAAVDAAVRPSA